MTRAQQEYLNARLAMYLEAEQAILTGQSYTIGNRQLTRPSIRYVQAEIRRLRDEGAMTSEEMGDRPRRAVRRVVLHD